MPRHSPPGGHAAMPADGRPPQKLRTVRERLGALRNLGPFLKLVWRTSPALTAGDLALRLVRSVLPVAMLFVGKLIIDEVIALAQAPTHPDALRGWLDAGLLDRLAWLVALELGLAVLSDVLGRIVSL